MNNYVVTTFGVNPLLPRRLAYLRERDDFGVDFKFYTNGFVLGDTEQIFYNQDLRCNKIGSFDAKLQSHLGLKELSDFFASRGEIFGLGTLIAGNTKNIALVFELVEKNIAKADLYSTQRQDGFFLSLDHKDEMDVLTYAVNRVFFNIDEFSKFRISKEMGIYEKNNSNMIIR